MITSEIQTFNFDQTAFEKMLKEIGEKYARVKVLEAECHMLREQNRELTQKLLDIQTTLKEQGIL